MLGLNTNKSRNTITYYKRIKVYSEPFNNQLKQQTARVLRSLGQTVDQLFQKSLDRASFLNIFAKPTVNRETAVFKTVSNPVGTFRNYSTKQLNPYFTNGIPHLALIKKKTEFLGRTQTEAMFEQKRNFSLIPKMEKLKLLEAEANKNLKDSKIQHLFLEELIANEYYDILVERFENIDISFDGNSFQLYIEALIQSGNTKNISAKAVQAIEKRPNLKDSIPKLTQSIKDKITSFENSRDTNNSILGSTSKRGEKLQPIHVVLQEGSGLNFWKVVRSMGTTVIYLFFIFTFLSLILENSGLVKGAQNSHDFDAEQKSTVTFKDVQGADEAKEELQEIIDFLKNPQKFVQLGGKLPKGVLLQGPPGTGKTLLARAVAGEANVPFLLMSGSEFDEMYVGVGARRVRELFAAAKKKAPAIIFIDEIDAVGSKRNPKDQTYVKQTLNQLLVELDGFSQNEGVVLIGATNFPQLLDKALIRPGRFDRHINVSLPDVRGRIKILKVHCKKISVDTNVDISAIARGTPGFSGAELANLVNIAAIQASKKGKLRVGTLEFEHAKDRIIMGAEKKSFVMTNKDKLLTAYHEGGHALAAYYTKGAIPLHKATILPRGQSLGMTVQLPEMDKTNYTKLEYQAMLDVCMGGRVAEELIYGKDHVTSGAHNDLQKATQIARSMVVEMGMNEKVGPVDYSESYEKLSSKTKELIENEIKAVLSDSFSRVSTLLKNRKKELKRLADSLMENETLDAKQIDASINGKPIN